VRVTVVSTIRSQPPMVADELRRQADSFVDLVDLAPQIKRQHQNRDPGAVRETRAPRAPHDSLPPTDPDAPGFAGRAPGFLNAER
jgi:hypothetical protein